MSDAPRRAFVVFTCAVVAACGTKATPVNQPSQRATDADIAAIKAVQDREIAVAATGNPDSLL